MVRDLQDKDPGTHSAKQGILVEIAGLPFTSHTGALSLYTHSESLDRKHEKALNDYLR